MTITPPHIGAGRSILIAVSGGLDSMCLMHWLVQWQHLHPTYFKSLHVAHIHHGLRGKESDADAQHVQRTCQQLKLPYHQRDLHGLGLDGYPLQSSGGMEARAREARYQLLHQIRLEQGLDWIATAHHQNDQVETLLLRILRGTGIQGLVGVHPLRQDGVWRPLLQWTRQSLVEYAKQHQISWREDQSNLSRRYARNRIRHQLIPHLKKQVPEFENQLLSISQIALAITQKLELNTANWTLQTRILTQIPIQKPDTRRVLLDLYRVFPKGQVHLDSFQIRTRQDGDLFCPPGLETQNRKLKKFFNEQGIPIQARSSLPLLTMGSTVLWIPGVAISGYHQAKAHSRQILEIEISPIKSTQPLSLD